MAGVKETPRQKMIGMMYLVLTALLALQVSNTVLEKFVFINKSLERSVSDGVMKNTGTVQRVQSSVSESGNRPNDVAVLKTAETVRAKTSEVLENLNQLKAQIIDITGGVDEDGNYVDVKDEDKLANLMINNKRGEELKQLLNDYSAFLTETTGRKFEDIALDAKDNKEFRDNPDQKRKSFSELTFGNTPMAAGLASISQLQTEVVSRESEALDDLARRVGASDLKFDRIVAMVRPESKIVAAGTKYSAELFIAASSSGVTPTMKKDGQPIPVDPSGMGKVEFTANAGGGEYDKDGLAKKTYEAAITMKMPGGLDTTFVNKIEYIVAKPVIQVQSKSVQALYRNCGNELNVQVPALGAIYNPDFNATGAAVIKGKEKGVVTIIPGEGTTSVKLNVLNGGNLLGFQEFRVRNIPRPEIKFFSRGKEINDKQGESIASLRSLEIKVIADESFKEFLPNDARYRVAEWEITLARGSRPVAPPKRVTAQDVNLTDLLQKAQPGDRFVVEVKGIQRMNFRDQVENIKVGETKIVSLN
ncbi:gliding motility protein GldM [soil metagenome]